MKNSMSFSSLSLSGISGANLSGEGPKRGRPVGSKNKPKDGISFFDADLGGSENTSDKRKQSLYFPADMLERAQAEAKRLDRSLSWVFQRCFNLAIAEVQSLPTINEISSSFDAEE